MPDFAHPEPKHLTRARRTAEDFRTNEQMEDLLILRQDNPTKFATFPAHLKIKAGLYESDRTTAQQPADHHRQPPSLIPKKRTNNHAHHRPAHHGHRVPAPLLLQGPARRGRPPDRDLPVPRYNDAGAQVATSTAVRCLECGQITYDGQDLHGGTLPILKV